MILRCLCISLMQFGWCGCGCGCGGSLQGAEAALLLHRDLAGCHGLRYGILAGCAEGRRHSGFGRCLAPHQGWRHSQAPRASRPLGSIEASRECPRGRPQRKWANFGRRSCASFSLGIKFDATGSKELDIACRATLCSLSYAVIVQPVSASRSNNRGTVVDPTSSSPRHCKVPKLHRYCTGICQDVTAYAVGSLQDEQTVQAR